MKLSKKFVSAILVGAMTMSLVAPAAAAMDTDAQENTDIGTEVVTPLREDGYVMMTTKDYENGDADFCLYEGNILVSKYHLDRSESTIYEWDGNGNLLGKQIYEKAFSNTYVARATKSYTTAGKVGYTYYMQGTAIGTRYVTLKYMGETFKTPSYRPQGQYKSIVELAGIIATILGIPGVISSGAASLLLTAAGIAIDATNFCFENNAPTIEANGYKMTWKGTSDIGKSTTVVGTKYDFKTSNGKRSTEYDGDYYAYSKYTSHNTAFAGVFYERLWGVGDGYEVSSWT